MYQIIMDCKILFLHRSVEWLVVGELNLFPMQCLYYKEEGVYLQEKGQVKEFIPVVSSVPNMANIKEREKSNTNCIWDVIHAYIVHNFFWPWNVVLLKVEDETHEYFSKTWAAQPAEEKHWLSPFPLAELFLMILWFLCLADVSCAAYIRMMKNHEEDVS